MANYIDEHKNKIQETPGGKLCQVFGKTENASCSIALVEMDQNNNGVKHYHDNITEIYMFTKGKGKIIINEHINNIEEGDCYIITPNNVHYIESIEKMNFLCICTPPWEEQHEFIEKNNITGHNINKYTQYGILQTLSNTPNHNVSRLKITEEFIPNKDTNHFRRVYYFISGEGTITIDNNTYKINKGNCFEVKESSTEIITPTNELDFISVYDKLNTYL